MQTITHARVGYGQGWSTPAKTVEKKVIRVRTGASLVRGEFIGGRNQPRAFVWQDEDVPMPTREIIVRVGREGYLWEGSESLDLTVAFPDRKDLAKIVSSLACLQRHLAKQAETKQLNRFWWGRFHQDGLQLARKLQAALINDAVVLYERSSTDPAWQFDPRIEL
jgi:hypothetical protein